MPTQFHNTVLLITDQQRSVLNVIDEQRPHPIAYTSYGYRPLTNGLLSLQGFNGELPDSLTGFYLLGNGYRAFNSLLMRFNSPDSWSPFGEGGLNYYAYCMGDPVNRTDPTGHTPQFLKPLLRSLRIMKKPAQTRVNPLNASTSNLTTHFDRPRTPSFSLEKSQLAETNERLYNETRRLLKTKKRISEEKLHLRVLNEKIAGLKSGGYELGISIPYDKQLTELTLAKLKEIKKTSTNRIISENNEVKRLKNRISGLPDYDEDFLPNYAQATKRDSIRSAL